LAERSASKVGSKKISGSNMPHAQFSGLANL